MGKQGGGGGGETTRRERGHVQTGGEAKGEDKGGVERVSDRYEERERAVE